MANVPAVFFRDDLPAEGTPVALLVPEGETWTVTNIVAVNTMPTAASVSASLGGKEILPDFELDPKDVLVFDTVRQVLNTGDELLLFASAAGVVAHVSGILTTGF